MKTFDFVDSTLRDGEQTAGVVFSPEEQMEIARLLDRVGIRWIEAGVPAMGSAEREFLSELHRAGLSAQLISWNRMRREDVDFALSCGFRYIHLSIPLSDIHIQYKFQKDRAWVLNQIEDVVGYAASFGVSVFLGGEDAARADREFFLRAAETAEKAGASRIRYADTIGCMDPFRVRGEMEYLSARCPLPIEFHGHNDFGLAAANTLAAYKGGAAFVSVTSTGIGERAGNACLEEIVTAMECLYHYDCELHPEHLPALRQAVSKAANRENNGKHFCTKMN
ncbi:MAG: homocitrate synthase [Oscillospiraceae bacterium]|nr:homocitrate synthase [Oscillospiraceae bacterium]